MRTLFGVGAALYLLAPWLNPGFVALDDYTSLTEFFVPAQNQSVSKIIENSEIRSPIPRLMLFGISHTLWKLGVENPFLQYQIVLTILGLFSFLVFAFCACRLYGSRPEWLTWALLLLGGFYLCPFFYSRAMIESLSAPYLLLGASFAVEYHQKSRPSALIASLLFLGIASTMRFQTGVCALALAALPGKRYRHWVLLAVGGLILFFVTGAIDGWLRGSFHQSLFSYVDYNVHHSSSYGTTPFYTYLLLWIAVLLPPTFFSCYRDFSLREKYQGLSPLWVFFAVFLVSHSLIPHKEERFMVPILPNLLLALVPAAQGLFSRSAARRNYFLTLNGFLLITTLFSTPQKNALELIQYLNRRPDISVLYDYEGSVVPYLSAFLQYPVRHFRLDASNMELWHPEFCGSVSAVRWDWTDRLISQGIPLRPTAVFKPAWPEALFIRLNPLRNARRGPITLYQTPECLR
ncbi:MAG: hypothetical protein H6617_08710 [Bdellovibrionaceae bacterium]|nr:hypothetical protein [Bdellovibrionales bacterium]MCB9254747.1 hypothetical protein [Pseudobdellovibrionaceae bacterium]